MEVKNLSHLSLKEYLEIEISSQTKYEYHDGAIYAMSGGTLNHGWICGNVFGEIRNDLREKGSGCRVMNSEIKLHISSKNSYVYPDAMVICGEVEKSESEVNAVTNPTVIVEVLSKTTESYDRGDKFFLYQTISSLKEYILIKQDKPQVEIYRRMGDLWQISQIIGMETNLVIPSLELTISLEEIYRDAEFEG